MNSPHPVLLPDGRKVFLTPRHVMESYRTKRGLFSPPAGSLPKVTLPIDWTQGGKLSFPILGNDQYGDCMYCAAVHLDQTFTGNVGTEATYAESAVVSAYKKLSGGDNGLDEQEITDAWRKGLAGNPDATILDSLDIDPTDAALCQSAIYLFGGVFFMLSVPSRWITEFKAGVVWDAPAIPNPMNGHGTCWNAVDAQGRYTDQTWGSYALITPAGVKDCDPSAFIVFSKRWFDPTTGLAPNGFSYDELADYWTAAGGKSLPANPFPTVFPS